MLVSTGKRLSAALLLLAVGVCVAPGAAATSERLEEARRDYSEALEALQRREWDDFTRLRSRLEEYPLSIYLDYYHLTRPGLRVPPEQANRFLQRSADSPLPNRFLARYLRDVGREKRWADFLAVHPEEPNSVVLKCYYFRARLAGGEREQAWRGARRLWVHGESRPDECDPLFDAWQAADQLTDALVWERLLQAFDARQRSLMRYVASKGSARLQPWTDRLQSVYASPDRLSRLSLPADSPYSADIASYGLAYLARYSPERALHYWRDIRPRLNFDAEQERKVEHAIALHALFARGDALRDWLHGALRRLGDDRLVGIRLRWALAERDWAALESTLPLLSAEAREENVWHYWEAVALSARGEKEAATARWRELAGERSYYGFLAAEKLGESYSFNHEPLVAADVPPLNGMAALRRIEELHFHDEAALAQSEWYKVLGDTADPAAQQELALLASGQGWYRMAIDAATRARAWDALDVRFPLAYRDVFDANARAQRVSTTELMAIARRESAFFPGARSPVGARGLMQIMPATGAQVASALGTTHSGADLFEVEHNVRLGSTYYRQLLDRYDGNRVLALAAYNAGPHRVDLWRREADASLPADLWIETIPYRETRNYVQAVLAYNVVFQYLMGDTRPLLTPDERQHRY
ncbi:MAG: transglycosylase SLT domain-containing protein [Halioglobus sp.]|nr:transglycosylase SLT domain-containing protein [Halioglobus sp.]